MSCWYTFVTFGSDPHLPPRGPWRTEREAESALARWRARLGDRAGTIESAHQLRRYTYATRRQARDASIADEPGERGRIA